jgi:hypothetical protein
MLYGASAGTTRIGYFDDFRVGSSYAAVDPSGGRPPASMATPADVGALPGGSRLHLRVSRR